jgi:DNA-binding CsgD family transcriptional regulator
MAVTEQDLRTDVEQRETIAAVRDVVIRMDQSLVLARQMAATLDRALASLGEALITLGDDSALRHGAECHPLSAAPGWTVLSRPEQDVAMLAAEGQTNAEISTALFVSINTVKTHLGRVFAKLDVRSRRELTRLAAHLRSMPVVTRQPSG